MLISMIDYANEVERLEKIIKDLHELKLKNEYLEEQNEKLKNENDEYKFIILKYSEKLDKKNKKIKSLELIKYKNEIKKNIITNELFYPLGNDDEDPNYVEINEHINEKN